MAFTIVFGILLVIQFLCMLLHRWKTLLQIYSSIDSSIDNMEELLMESCTEYYEANSKNMSESESQSVENRIQGALKYMKEKVEGELKKREAKQKCCSGCLCIYKKEQANKHTKEEEEDKKEQANEPTKREEEDKKEQSNEPKKQEEEDKNERANEPTKKGEKESTKEEEKYKKVKPENEEDKMTVLTRAIKQMSKKRLRKMKNRLEENDKKNGPSTSTYGSINTPDVDKKPTEDDSENLEQASIVQSNDSQKPNTVNSTTSSENGPSTSINKLTQNPDNNKPAEGDSRYQKLALPEIDEENGSKNPNNENTDTSYRYGPSARTYVREESQCVDIDSSEGDSTKPSHAQGKESDLTHVEI